MGSCCHHRVCDTLATFSIILTNLNSSKAQRKASNERDSLQRHWMLSELNETWVSLWASMENPLRVAETFHGLSSPCRQKADIESKRWFMSCCCNHAFHFSPLKWILKCSSLESGTSHQNCKSFNRSREHKTERKRASKLSNISTERKLNLLRRNSEFIFK